MNRAAIIFGLVAMKRADLLDEETRKIVAQSLISQLGTGRNIFLMAVIEILGAAFALWEPYIQTMAIFKALFQWLIQMSPPSAEDGTASAKIDPTILLTVKTAKSTLIQMITYKSIAIVPLWLSDLTTNRSTPDRILAIDILSQVVTTSPLCIRGFIPAIVDTLVRFLDPNSPNTRTRLLPHIRAFMEDLSMTFSSVQCHSGSQRWLVGGMDGICVLFDTKSATRAHIFEGHTKPITCLAFSPDTRHIVSYSYEEVTVRLWAVPSGLMSMLSVNCKPLKTLVVEPLLTESLALLPPEALLRAVSISWIDAGTIAIAVQNRRLLTMEVL